MLAGPPQRDALVTEPDVALVSQMLELFHAPSVAQALPVDASTGAPLHIGVPHERALAIRSGLSLSKHLVFGGNAELGHEREVAWPPLALTSRSAARRLRLRGVRWCVRADGKRYEPLADAVGRSFKASRMRARKRTRRASAETTAGVDPDDTDDTDDTDAISADEAEVGAAPLADADGVELHGVTAELVQWANAAHTACSVYPYLLRREGPALFRGLVQEDVATERAFIASIEAALAGRLF